MSDIRARLVAAVETAELRLARAEATTDANVKARGGWDAIPQAEADHNAFTLGRLRERVEVAQRELDRWDDQHPSPGR